MHLKQWIVGLMGGLVMGASANAAIVIDPVDASSDMTIHSGRGPANTKIIGGSGLSDATIVQTGDPEPGSWPTSSPGAFTNFTGEGTTGRFLFDLGAVYDVTSLHIWNGQENNVPDHEEGNLRGMKDATVYYSTTGINIGTLAGGTNGGAYEMPIAPGDTYAGDTVTFGSPLTARYILLDATSNWGGTAQMSVEEIRFIGTAAVPEPTTMGLIGLGAATCLIRRRRSLA
jgi:hypothetical protein